MSIPRMTMTAAVLVAMSTAGVWAGEQVDSGRAPAGSGSAAEISGEAPAVRGGVQAGTPAAPASHAGVVQSVIRASSYVYVQLDAGGKNIWAAAPAVPLQVGQSISFQQGLPMEKYYSKALGLTFDRVYFVAGLKVEGIAQAVGPAPEGVARPRPETGVDLTGIERPDGGKKIAEIFAQRDSLAGKEVLLRARVVKTTNGIMGKNWMHLQDGTGAPGSDDLTVTTKKTMVEVGDTVLVRGVLIKDKDFGYGYKYALIIEDAQVMVE